MQQKIKDYLIQLKIRCSNINKDHLRRIFLISSSIALLIATILITLYYFKIMSGVRIDNGFRLATQKEAEYFRAQDKKNKQEFEQKKKPHIENGNINNNTLTQNSKESKNQNNSLYEGKTSYEVWTDANNNSTAHTNQIQEKSNKNKSPQDIYLIIRKDQKAMIEDTQNKLKNYVEKTGSKYTLQNSLQRNIETRDKYIQYLNSNGLNGANDLEADNERDYQLLEDLKTNSRTYFQQFLQNIA